jgi:excisionase family DNA binding protein
MAKARLTTADAAEELGITVGRVKALIHAGRLHATKFGKSWMIPRGALAAVKVRKPGRPKAK